MARNILKRVLSSLVLIDEELDSVFVDYSNTGKQWRLITNRSMIHVCKRGGEIIGRNVSYKGAALC